MSRSVNFFVGCSDLAPVRNAIITAALGLTEEIS